MIGKTPKEHQMSIFEVALESFIDMNHELVLLSKQIDWEAVESEFAEYYCADNGRPSVPIRKMVGMMLLKNIYNLSDEGVVVTGNEPCRDFGKQKCSKIGNNRTVFSATTVQCFWQQYCSTGKGSVFFRFLKFS